MGMRSLLACVILIMLASSIAAEPVLAQPDMSIPFITTPWFVAARPAHNALLVIIETNQSHLAATDNEAFALSFPAGIFSSISPAAGATFDFSGPTIAQTSARTIVADRTYMFQDFTTV